MTQVGSMVVPVKTAEQNLEQLLEELNLGQTLTLLGSEGRPLAVVVSLKPAAPEAQSQGDRQRQWHQLAEEIGRAWKDEKSAVEVVSEMRR